ncbi:hypothetical protein PUN28_007438 [Cardiocondyla obscurior]|uniref:Uncharacterized protein n=1 Tax=Cardiocondyla obscurior TaxID=286306 RepID=A0AAW2G386_9HYME
MFTRRSKKTGTKEPFLSFAFLPKAPVHLTRDTRTSRILIRSICTAPGRFSEKELGRTTRRISRHERGKKISKREENTHWFSPNACHGQFPEIFPLDFSPTNWMRRKGLRPITRRGREIFAPVDESRTVFCPANNHRLYSR